MKWIASMLLWFLIFHFLTGFILSVSANALIDAGTLPQESATTIFPFIELAALLLPAVAIYLGFKGVLPGTKREAVSLRKS